ncbi:MAG: glycosyltransferase family 4 protein [Ignavibacteriae bacterium]|nr:glycosyltransferase family 4 protein [Ignavibacteriota bacterium]
MKQRVALVRGPGLNSWEMQLFLPLTDAYEMTAFVSQSHYFEINEIPIEIRRLFSVGQLLRARILRKPMIGFFGDYHDLLGLKNALRGFDIVHSRDTAYYDTYQAARAKASCGFKFVVTVWENIPFLNNNNVAEKHKKFIFNEADLLLSVSERAKEVLLLEGAPEHKIKVLMPGIDCQHFRSMSKDRDLLQKFKCRDDDFVVLYVANLYREKGIFELLFAFRMMLNRNKSGRKLKLLIVGQGKERKKVLYWIEKLSLQRDAFLIGSYPYEIMPKIHNLADVFILPSLPSPTWQEQFGYVLIESMACGKPIISTMSGSIPEVVGDAGILVQSNDFVSIQRVIEAFLNDECMRHEYGMRARLRAEKHFDSRKVSAQLRKLYGELYPVQQ